MDRATWLQVTFGMGLVGVNLLPGGADPDGPGLTYLDPEDPARTPQRIPWPPSPGEAGVISRGRFGSAGWIALWTTVGDRGHRYPTVAVSAAGDYVVVADEHGAELELYAGITHPDGRTRLFTGVSIGIGAPRVIEVFDAEGELVARLEL